ncbi:MAG: TIGR02281 family clan AA aspartic protease [Stappiaceae bacterium]
MSTRPFVIVAIALACLAVIGATFLYWPQTLEELNFDDTGPRLVFLSALLVFIGGGFLAARPRFSELVKGIVVWGGLLVLLIAGYAMRNDLSYYAERTLGSLIPGMTIQAPDGSISVVESQNGHFYLDADVDGQSIRFLVDTGASTVSLTAKDAEKIGYAPDQLNYSFPVSTANGAAFVAPIKLDRLSIGNYTTHKLNATVSRAGSLDQSLLGMNALRGLSSWRVEGDRLILTP